MQGIAIVYNMIYMILQIKTPNSILSCNWHMLTHIIHCNVCEEKKQENELPLPCNEFTSTSPDMESSW